MSPEENKSIARGYMEQVWNKGRLDLFDEFISKDAVPHGTPGVTDAESMKLGLVNARKAFPDICITVDDEIAVDDKVTQRWTASGTNRGDFNGMPATGKQAEWSGITIWRLAGGKLVEFWYQADNMGLMQQLGVIPAPGG